MNHLLAIDTDCPEHSDDLHQGTGAPLPRIVDMERRDGQQEGGSESHQASSQETSGQCQHTEVDPALHVGMISTPSLCFRTTPTLARLTTSVSSQRYLAKCKWRDDNHPLAPAGPLNTITLVKL